MYRYRDLISKIAQINEAIFLQEAPITNLQPLLNQLQVETEEIEFIEVAHIAARLGRLDILQPLLNEFPLLFILKDGRGDIPLHVASRAGQRTVVEYLLNPTENGRTSEEVDYLRGRTNNKGNTALHEALENKHEAIAQLLFQFHGQSELLIWPNDEDKTPPYLAAEAGLWNLVYYMLPLVDVNQDPIPWKGKTSLHAAVIIRNQVRLRSVLDLQPQLIKVTDKEGRNPIHYAACIGYYDGLEVLLAGHKQQAYQPDYSGAYPIHLAACNGHIKVIQLLCQECPESWSLLFNEGRNILHIAALNDKEDVVRYILEEPVMEKLINNVDGRGNAPLHIASSCGNFKIVRALTKDKRVDMSICNNQNLTARDIVEESSIGELKPLRKMLTLIALRIANAPRARKLVIFDGRQLLSNYGRRETADRYKERINTLLLASTLVATVTFAAGFTIPGGLNANVGSDLGIATMLPKTMFKVYVVCDAIALFCSIVAVISLIWAQIGNVPLMHFSIRFAWALLGISLSMMAIAFSAGLYIVISPLHWLATAILILTLIFLICALALLLPLRLPILSKYCFFQSISYYFIYLLVAVVGSRIDHGYKAYNGDIEAQGNLITAPKLKYFMPPLEDTYM